MTGAIGVVDRPSAGLDQREAVAGRTAGRIAAPRTQRPHFPVRARGWVRPYLLSTALIDLAAGIVGATVGFALRVPAGGGPLAEQAASLYLPLALAFPLAWLAATCLSDVYDARVAGLGSEEFTRLGKAFVALLAVTGFASYALHAAVPRGYVVVALPLALLISAVGHYGARKALHRARAEGRAANSVVLVGDAESVLQLAEQMQAEKYAGLSVVGACVPAEQGADQHWVARLTALGLPILGSTDEVITAVDVARADTVAVASGQSLGPQRLRELSWEMETIAADLLVAPGLMEVAGPRLHIRPMTGLPLLHVEKPEFAGSRRVLKGLVDRSAALFGVLMLAPLLLLTWVAIRLDSRGPAFFRQTRVGKDGREFTIWKFRSMHTDAEARLAALQSRSDGNEVLFKMKDDPRVTRVGKYLRRFSIDELPQLFNVLNGTMSLVGPRPPLPAEVAQYGDDVRRRLLVRPGLTGLWQVSGRSDLSWEESVRLDLRYVENWTLGQDAQILWKTAAAVVKGSGAY